jgi:hypothetical protein
MMQQPTRPKRKINKLWIYVSVVVVAIIGIGMTATYVFVKDAAVKTASVYMSNVQIYHDDVYDTAVTAAANPDSVDVAIQNITQPVLGDALFGEWFDEYNHAIDVQTQTAAQVALLETKVEDSADFYSFYSDYRIYFSELESYDSQGAEAAQSGSNSRLVNYMTLFNEKLQQINQLIQDARVPTDQQSNLESLRMLYETMSVHWAELRQAYINSDIHTYTIALDAYIAASETIPSVEKPLQGYFNSLTNKTKQSANEFRVFSDSVK